MTNIPDKTLDEILTNLDERAIGEAIRPVEQIYRKEAIKAITRWNIKQKIQELQRVLDNSSGGGNWRRNIITIIAQLKSELKSEVE